MTELIFILRIGHYLNITVSESALLGSSITILATNLIMIFTSIIQMILNGYNAFNCFTLAYGSDKNVSALPLILYRFEVCMLGKT